MRNLMLVIYQICLSLQPSLGMINYKDIKIIGVFSKITLSLIIHISALT